MNSENQPIKKLYYSIGEVSRITELKAYVLRYWETEFKQLNPPKNRAGNRTYRQKDIDTLFRIKELLYDRKFTIEGARHQLSLDAHTKGKEAGSAAAVESKGLSTNQKEILVKIKQDLAAILEIIQE